MPLVRLTIRTGKSSEYKKALLDGVHRALVQAFRIRNTTGGRSGF